MRQHIVISFWFGIAGTVFSQILLASVSADGCFLVRAASSSIFSLRRVTLSPPHFFLAHGSALRGRARLDCIR